MAAETQKLIDAFKACCEIEDQEYETQFQADWVGAECDTIRFAIIRLLDELDPAGYVECIMHYGSLETLSPDVTVETRGATA